MSAPAAAGSAGTEDPVVNYISEISNQAIRSFCNMSHPVHVSAIHLYPTIRMGQWTPDRIGGRALDMCTSSAIFYSMEIGRQDVILLSVVKEGSVLLPTVDGKVQHHHLHRTWQGTCLCQSKYQQIYTAAWTATIAVVRIARTDRPKAKWPPPSRS